MKEDSTCSMDENARKPAVEKRISRMNESRLVAVLRRNDRNVTALVTHRLSISNEIIAPLSLRNPRNSETTNQLFIVSWNKSGPFLPTVRPVAGNKAAASLLLRSARFIK